MPHSKLQLIFDQAEAVIASVSKLKRINERRLLKGLSNKNASREIINTTAPTFSTKEAIAVHCRKDGIGNIK